MSDDHPPSGALGERLRRFVNGGIGTAGAVLLPRIWSVSTQWLVAGAAGTAALTDYLTTTTRGSAAVSLVANALAPVLILRRGAMRTAGGRALVGVSMLLIALAAFALTFAFEATLGLGAYKGIFTGAFASMTVMGAPAVVTWPLWQSRNRFLPLVGVMIVVLLVASTFALVGNAQLAAVTVGLGSAIPTVAMLGRARMSRAARYAFSVARRALPLSSMSFATALVYPLSLQLGTDLFGARMVGQQLLFWPVVLALGIVSQSMAARFITAAHESNDLTRGLGRWLASALAIAAAAALAYAVFRWRSLLPAGMLVAAAAFIFSDPICIYFCPPTGWRRVAVGSVAAAFVVGGCVLLWPRFVIEHYSVCGPSAIVAALRLGFVNDPSLRRTARITLAMLAAGFAATAWLR